RLRTSATMVLAWKVSCKNRQASATAHVPYLLPRETGISATLSSHWPVLPGWSIFWARTYPSFWLSRSMIQIAVSELPRCRSSQFLWVSSEINPWLFDWDRTLSSLRTVRRNGPSPRQALRNVNAAVVIRNRASLRAIPARVPAHPLSPPLRLRPGFQFPVPRPRHVGAGQGLAFPDPSTA